MKKIPLVFLLICAAISLAYSFQCYNCLDESSEKCNEKQTNVTCTGSDKMCLKADGELESGKTIEARSCSDKNGCDEAKKKCDDGTATFGDDGDKFKTCRIACCVPDGETPCNSAFTVTSSMVMMMVAILLSFNAF